MGGFNGFPGGVPPWAPVMLFMVLAVMYVGIPALFVWSLVQIFG